MHAMTKIIGNMNHLVPLFIKMKLGQRTRQKLTGINEIIDL